MKARIRSDFKSGSGPMKWIGMGLLACGSVFLTVKGDAAPGDAGLPPGLVELAGRLSHNHWHLMGESNRSRLDELNRTLRESDQRARTSSAPEVQRRARERRNQAAAELLNILEDLPQSIRLNLTTPRPTFEFEDAVELPGTTGALVFRIDAGPGETTCATTVADLSAPRGESSLVTFEVGERGTTWAMATLENLPVDRTTLVVEVRRPGHTPVRLPLQVRTPRPGRLRLTVLSADTGQPVPAMVRLMWRVDGLSRRPPNGIDFAPQMDRQGNPGGARAANLPGALGAHFWCVPGPFDMALSPGTWQVGVRRGVEHEAVFEDLEIRTGEVTERVITPRRWVDMRKRGWWSGDDHVHGQILSDDDAERLLAWVRAEDVHLANVVKMGDIYRTYFEQRGFGREYRVSSEETVLSPGQECPRTHDQLGHTLAMNITNMVRDTDSYYLYDRVFDAVRAQGGLSGYAHVNSGLFHVHRDMSLNIPAGRVDFVELIQFNHLGTELYYDFLNLGFKMTASAGSDVPWGGTIGEVRAYAFLGDEPFSADAWFEAFRRGRTFTTSGPMIELRVDEAWPGDEIRVEEDREVRVRARAWGDPGRMGSIKLEIVRHGEVVGAAESRELKRPVAELDFALASGHGAWIAARAEAGDGTRAHTTPVYVMRGDLPFWKYSEIDQLIGKRMASLRQIEAIVEEAEALERAGKLGEDRPRSELARQGADLLERVKFARAIYEGLRERAEFERRFRL